MIAHTGQKDQCNVCHKMFSIISIERHKKLKHGEKKYKCNFCEFETALKYHQKEHELNVHIGKRTEIQCLSLNCEKVFYTKSNMMNHYRSIHRGIKYSCEWDGCTYQAKRTQSVKHHTDKVHKNKIPKMHTCNLCSYQSQVKASLKKHIKSVHDQWSMMVSYTNEVINLHHKWVLILGDMFTGSTFVKKTFFLLKASLKLN